MSIDFPTNIIKWFCIPVVLTRDFQLRLQAKHNNYWEIILIQNFQYKNTNAINNCGEENSLCGIVLVCIDINSEKHRISQQRQGADRGNSFIVCDEETKKFDESKSPVTDKINNRKTDDRTQQTKH